MMKLVAFLSVMLLLVTLSESLSYCCTSYQGNPVAFKKLKAFRLQEITDFCNLEAVIFKTVKNKFFCADPNEAWVKKAMQRLSQRNGKAA